MPSSTAITTFLRLRPSKHGSGYFAVDPSAPNKVEVSVPPEEAAGLHVNHKRNQWRFSFDGVLETRATQEEVFERVAEHRELFFRFSWVDYTTHKPGTFRLTPPPAHLSAWKADYADMLGPMFFGDTPTFEEMIAAATEFESTFNTI